MASEESKTFSSKIKEEIIKCCGENIQCMYAELLGFILSCSENCLNTNTNTIKLDIENDELAKKYFTFLKKTFNINVELMHGNMTNRKKFVNTIVLKEARFILSTLSSNKLADICCKRAYLRGAFLAVGSVSDPQKGYHLEFVSSNSEYAHHIQSVMAEINLDAKVVMRKNNYVVYLKDGSQIVDLLNIIGAHIALMDFENIRIVKEVRNNINRLVNCEIANLSKTVSAAVKQIEDITYIQDTKGLSYLPPNLEILAKNRLLYKEASLKELGQQLDPPIGKSGINHRFKKIADIAMQIREERERGGF
ncbi:MAG: DNA-binding protein WhiA [Epulopiscium sp. Nele67-Bin004]|nr:MAG: DNA-binding protein WhiA [Epulopiscium sp. Nele67-Bin004]